MASRMDLPPLSRHRDVLMLLSEEWRAWGHRSDQLRGAFVRGGLPQPRSPRPGMLLASTEDCSPGQTSKHPSPFGGGEGREGAGRGGQACYPRLARWAQAQSQPDKRDSDGD